jgi:hypothetical protein
MESLGESGESSVWKGGESDMESRHPPWWYPPSMSVKDRCVDPCE